MTFLSRPITFLVLLYSSLVNLQLFIAHSSKTSCQDMMYMHKQENVDYYQNCQAINMNLTDLHKFLPLEWQISPYLKWKTCCGAQVRRLLCPFDGSHPSCFHKWQEIKPECVGGIKQQMRGTITAVVACVHVRRHFSDICRGARDTEGIFWLCGHQAGAQSMRPQKEESFQLVSMKPTRRH